VTTETWEIDGVRVLACAEAGPPLSTYADAVAIMNLSLETGARTVVIPIARLGDGFLTLETGLAGAFIQKFVTYERRLVFLGEIPADLAARESLRAYVRESNRGVHVWFLPDRDALEARLREEAQA
jgi:hypothetical protein